MLCAAVAVNVAMFHPALAQEAGDDVEEVIVTAEKLGRSAPSTTFSIQVKLWPSILVQHRRRTAPTSSRLVRIGSERSGAGSLVAS